MYPTDKIKEGCEISVLESWELIALVFGNGKKGKNVLDMAREVAEYLNKNGFSVDLSRILEDLDVGFYKSCQILACLELSKRFLGSASVKKVQKPEDVLPFVNFLKGSEQENFVCVTLDGANQVISEHLLTQGLVNQTQIHPREAFRRAIFDNAVSVIFVHNHPSGNPEPSQADIHVTRMLIEAGVLLHIHVLDHLIITPYSWESIKRKKPELWL